MHTNIWWENQKERSVPATEHTAVKSVENQLTFRMGMSLALLAAWLKLLSFLAYSSTLKMEAKCCSET
jgi:hypothetical protein